MSSRLTSVEVIAEGHYLKSDFDPSTLTVAQLLGIFGFHNINYPTTYTKPKLVQLFNEEIKKNGKKFNQERLSRQTSLASEDGITDGHTGKPLGESRTQAPVRRSSRRLSRPASKERQPDATKAEPTKRRRSSAEPSLGGPSRRRTAKPKPSEPALAEESEPEETVVRKVSRSKKTSVGAGAQARRLAQDEHDSGWEDNNIFQSGAESSSPLRPSPVRPRTRRTSAVSTRSRKSMSAPPEYAISPVKGKEKAKPATRRAPSVKPPESNFEPDLPAEVTRETRSSIMRAARASAVPEIKESRPTVQAIPEEEDETVEYPSEEYLSEQPLVQVENYQFAPVELTETEMEALKGHMSDEDMVLEVSRRIAGQSSVVRPAPPLPTTSTSLPALYRVALFLLTLTTAYLVYDFKNDSVRIGFCETGQASNDVLRGLQARWSAIDTCNRENRTYLYLPNSDGTQSGDTPTPRPTTHVAAEIWAFSDGERDGQELCPAPPLLPFPHPEHCTPCPAHAVCTPSTMTCETGYLIRPHPVLFFLPLSATPYAPHAQNSYSVPSYFPPTATSGTMSEVVYKSISRVLDGLPALGSVALPPRCVEDPRRKARVGALGTAIESFLASRRGSLICEGAVSDKSVGTDTEAKTWGLEIEALKENMKTPGMKKNVVPHLLAVYEDNFNQAIQQLLQWGGVFIGEDTSGKRYIASKSIKMDWSCATKVKARGAWKQWRNQVFVGVLSMMVLVAARKRRVRNAVESQRVAVLVQTVLESLRNQELAHHTDPVTAPHPFLSSLQLRDLILQDEHSVGTRRRVWERVEHVVESNANVRTNLEEMVGGDEMRVWRWVGSAGKTLSPASERPAILSGDNENQAEA